MRCAHDNAIRRKKARNRRNWPRTQGETAEVTCVVPELLSLDDAGAAGAAGPPAMVTRALYRPTGLVEKIPRDDDGRHDGGHWQ